MLNKTFCRRRAKKGKYDYDYGSKKKKNGINVISIKDLASFRILDVARKEDLVQLKIKRHMETIGISIPIELFERLYTDIMETKSE
jgi:hypothetical protein